ncbi:hypothetical protein TNCV_2000481 [Trichonephila clavipes]|nr:hypothetical protein TNCV_2000481 [Trichonephila clavipes]
MTSKLKDGHDSIGIKDSYALDGGIACFDTIAGKGVHNRSLIPPIIHVAVTFDGDEHYYEYEITFYSFGHGNGNDVTASALFQESALAVSEKLTGL